MSMEIIALPAFAILCDEAVTPLNRKGDGCGSKVRFSAEEGLSPDFAAKEKFWREDSCAKIAGTDGCL